MTIDGGHLVAKALAHEGVKAVFTLCGGHIAPIYEGCLREGIRVVDCRHEQAAGHAADAYARLTRGIGVALVTAGPGVTDAVTAVANAYHAQSPMILIGGKSPNYQSGKGSLQEMEQVALFRTITKFAQAIPSAKQIPEIFQTAVRHALSGVPGPVFLELAVDVLLDRVEEEDVAFSKSSRSRARPYGDPGYIAEAAKILSAAERPAIFAGSSIWWDDAREQLVGLAETLDAPVLLNGMARGALPANHPLFFSHARSEIFKKNDAILVVGAPLDFRVKYGEAIPPSSKLIRVDRDPTELGRNRPAEVGIVGDSRAVLSQLKEALGKGLRHETWVRGLREKEEDGRRIQEARERSDAMPLNHFRFAREVADAVDDNTIVIGDGGDIVAVVAKVMPQRFGQWMDPGPLGCLGVGVPFAMAAKLLYPEKKVLVVSGDGSFGLNGFEHEACLRQGIPIVTVVGNDAAWGQIRGPQIAFYGEERAVGTGLAPTRYDKIVEAMGGLGEHVERPGEVTKALERAFASNGVACVNVPIDPTTMRDIAASKGLTI